VCAPSDPFSGDTHRHLAASEGTNAPSAPPLNHICAHKTPSSGNGWNKSMPLPNGHALYVNNTVYSHSFRVVVVALQHFDGVKAYYHNTIFNKNNPWSSRHWYQYFQQYRNTQRWRLLVLRCGWNELEDDTPESDEESEMSL
jgi:hypothetical protein